MRGYDVVGVKGAAHDDDRHDNVALVIQTGDTEPWHIANRDFGNILDLDWERH